MRLIHWVEGLTVRNLIVPMLLFVLVVAIQLVDWHPVAAARDRLDGLLYDAKVRYLPAWPESVTNIQIVDIDERSLAAVGRMPWSREHFANLTSKLAQAGAIVIAYDVLFAESQTNPVDAILAELETSDDTLRLSLTKYRHRLDYDGLFAQSMQQTDVVLSVLLHRDRDIVSGKPLQAGVLSYDSMVQNPTGYPLNVVPYIGYAGSIPRLAEQAAGLGFMNAQEDADGLVRRAALVLSHNGLLLPSLALETMRVYTLNDRIEASWETLGRHAFFTGITVGNRTVATDLQGRVLIPFQGPAKHYPYTSAVDVLSGDKALDQFDQAVVFVGTSAAGLADLRPTPVGLGYPGVEIQATLFDALLNPQYIVSQPEWWREALLLELVLVAVYGLLVMHHRSPAFTAIAAIVLLTLVAGGNLLLWFYAHLTLPIFCPLLLLLLLTMWYVSRGFFAENQQRRKVKAVFDQYVPAAHIERLLKAPEAFSLEGEKKVLTVMFSDIRSFTTISESMSADELKSWLNAFFSPITEAILRSDGTIDKYVGDMVMAFWGAPLEQPQHANKAIEASFAMLAQLAPLNRQFASDNLPQAHIGIGISTGEMNVGDMGSSFRRAYTVLGDKVNLGSRLEGLTKYYGVDILVSDETRDQASAYLFVTVDKVKVKGKHEPVSIFSPLEPGVSTSIAAQIKSFNRVMAYYFAADFSAAALLLSDVDSEFPFPKLVELYQQRIEHFIHHPPSSDWDGSFEHTQK